MRSNCVELFRRVLFNILIHNSDDHLRNHGFFVDEGGIRLRPLMTSIRPLTARS